MQSAGQNCSQIAKALTGDRWWLHNCNWDMGVMCHVRVPCCVGASLSDEITRALESLSTSIRTPAQITVFKRMPFVCSIRHVCSSMRNHIVTSLHQLQQKSWVIITMRWRRQQLHWIASETQIKRTENSFEWNQKPTESWPVLQHCLTMTTKRQALCTPWKWNCTVKRSCY